MPSSPAEGFHDVKVSRFRRWTRKWSVWAALRKCVVVAAAAARSTTDGRLAAENGGDKF